MGFRIKHAPDETGPVCGSTKWVFPRNFAIEISEKITCPECLIELARRGEEAERDESSSQENYEIIPFEIEGKKRMYVAMCRTCGASVLRKDLHDEFHRITS